MAVLGCEQLNLFMQSGFFILEAELIHLVFKGVYSATFLNLCPAQPRYALPLQTV